MKSTNDKPAQVEFTNRLGTVEDAWVLVVVWLIVVVSVWVVVTVTVTSPRLVRK